MPCWPRTLLWLAIAILGSINLLAACGQKGPLYLPPAEDPPPTQAEAAR